MSQQRCFVYKSLGKADTYLYVVRADDFSAVPTALLETLGRLEHVMALDLSPQRKLARADAADVIEALAGRGYYLQLPPPPDHSISAES